MTILNGKVDVGTGLIIGPEFTEVEFLNSPVGMVATVFVKNGAHHSYKLKNVNIGGITFLPLLYFFDGKLTEIHLHPAVASKQNWATYSFQSETEHRQDNDSWLQETIGAKPPYVFSWGTIESVLDKKSGAAFVLLRYSNE